MAMRNCLRGFLIGAWIGGAALTWAAAASRPSPALLQSLPPPVRRTVQAEVGNGRLDSVNLTNGDAGEVLYDVDFTRAAKSRNMTVAADGALLDIQVYPNEVPAAALNAIRSHSQGAQLGDITKNLGDNDDVSYEAEVTRDGAKRTFTVDEKGVLIETQVLLSETPPSVQEAIKSNVGPAVLNEIHKEMDGDDVSFNVIMTKSGRRRSFSVSGAGELLESQVFADELPAPVQKAVQAQAKRGRLGKINQSTDEGEAYYEAAITVGHNTSLMTFDASGSLDSQEDDIPWAALPAKVKIALRSLQAVGEEVNDVTRLTSGTNTAYEIELSLGPTRRSLSFDKDGNTKSPRSASGGQTGIH
jgi:hypothetical protein